MMQNNVLRRFQWLPANTQLTPWPDDLPKWDTLDAESKKLFAGQAEVFAGYAAYVDDEIGRIIQAVEDLANTSAEAHCKEELGTDGDYHGGMSDGEIAQKTTDWYRCLKKQAAKRKASPYAEKDYIWDCASYRWKWEDKNFGRTNRYKTLADACVKRPCRWLDNWAMCGDGNMGYVPRKLLGQQLRSGVVLPITLPAPQLLPSGSAFTTCKMNCDTVAMNCQTACVPGTASVAASLTAPAGVTGSCNLACTNQQLVCKQSCGPGQ